MIATEKEAGEKYCVDWIIPKDYTPYCIASKCMAWKWLTRTDTRVGDRRGCCGKASIVDESP